MENNIKCNLNFNFDGDKTKVVNDLKNAVLSSGGVFNGDLDKGEAISSNPVNYHLEYEFLPKTLNIKIYEKPFYLTCSLIETSIKEYLKNYDKQLIINLINMSNEENKELSNFNTYVEDLSNLLPKPQNGPNTNIWVKSGSIEIPGSNTPTGTNQQIKIKLAESSSWPETKTEIKVVCRTVFGVEICTDLPVTYRRTCNKRFNLILEHPSLNSVRKEVEDCVNSSAAVAIAILVSSGNIALATTTFKSSFISCLKLKGVQIANEISIKIQEEKKCGSWRNIS